MTRAPEVSVAGTTTESVISREGSRDAGIIQIIYILYLIGFFTGITALIGVVMAYVFKGNADRVGQSHFRHQIRVFWRGVMLLAITVILYLIILVASAFLSTGGALMMGGQGGLMAMGGSFLLFLIPLALGLCWIVWTIIQVIRGMRAMGAGEPIPA